ncbi:hypothetical protein EWM64_g5792 [Hericium alpestre]|uniref:Arsenite methyltransferase n=1 Tax=Hericium alpestre TaxID=135208 RepID=A0A4Y9ZVM7_9AGAM|nr:hypothetical protein EWM64_g5792 [Hericium alpestre]
MRMLAQEEEVDDTEVTWEDQQRINSFSKLNTRMRSIEEKLEELKQEKEALDDLSTELELADEDEPVLYKIGEAFLHLPHSKAMKRLEADEEQLNAEIAKLTGSAEDCERDHANRVAGAFGYTAEELAAIPDGSHMGVSCGNPTATAKLKKGEVVLDLGCGGGVDVFLAAEKVGPTGRAIGIDVSDDMLARAEANAKKLGHLPPRVTFVKASLSEPFPNPPFADNTVDCVISNCVINLLPPEGKALVMKEVYRILKPRGRLALEDMVAKQELPEHVRNDFVAYAGCVGGAVTEAAYENNLHTAGFQDVLMVDKKADLNVWFNSTADGSTCGGSESSACGTVSSGCATPSSGLPRPSIDVNELVVQSNWGIESKK